MADIDPAETAEWREALASVMEFDGESRTAFLLDQMVEEARRLGARVPMTTTTPYVNTIWPQDEPEYPGDIDMERRIRAVIRWNAMMLVLRANKTSSELGGHLSSYQSASTFYETGFQHLWHAPSEGHGGDLLYIQGHCSPGIYSRAFVEGRLTEEQLDNFRQETGGAGLSSYPHPWLMPDFWQFPTVSMGLGPLMAIYQARFLKYLHARGLADTEGRKVWAFLGDGEMDEPESLGAISLAGREKLDNLVFVINCNLQRLDGPVRGNGKIIQELEGDFAGSGWNVIKVIWGSGWDELLAKDHTGALKRRMMECVDGQYQTYKSRDGAYVRSHFFGASPELAAMVADWTDEQIFRLNRGGHDPKKVYAAYAAAHAHVGEPTLILAKTVKGYGMGKAGEAQNTAHQAKKVDAEALIAFRDRFAVPVSDEEVPNYPYLTFAEGSPEYDYLHQHRTDLGGYLPQRRRTASTALNVPGVDAFAQQVAGSNGREVSTTMAFVQILTKLLRDKEIGKRIVPIVPDEARTFGMEGLFRQVGIYAPMGQLYEPADAEQLAFYKEAAGGQILEEGINEPGAMSSWIAAATSYATTDCPMIPFYIYYSMFGFQRIGDLAWAAGDMRARGFLLGGTAGRTTLNGEGLQHEDGHSHLQAALIPNCVSYDPTYSYELAVIVADGLRRMYADQEDVFYYLTLMNENYEHPAMPEGVEEGILKGMYLLRPTKRAAQVRLLGSGTILREVIAAADLLAADFGINAEIWSVPSFTELRREGLEVDRWNTLHPLEKPRTTYVEQCLGKSKAPVVASTDYMKSYADQIRAFVTAPYTVLGTDGFGRSDYRVKLRSHFEVDRHFIAVSALRQLADKRVVTRDVVAQAIEKYGINPDRPNPANA